MKVKQQPEDFQVEERTDATPGADGPFALYRLTKRGWTTHDALGMVRRRWKLDRRRISCGGLKDRHAVTTQHFTVLRGPRRKLSQRGIQVEYLGQLHEPFTSADIRANAFRITLRSLTTDQIEPLSAALEQVRHDGLPNYFDDQRFGSTATAAHFVARDMVLGRFEEALQQALIAPYEHDRAAQKKEKTLLREHWGDWTKCRDLLPRLPAPVAYLLQEPGDFRGALERLSPELRGLYLHAYQSHLWNRALAHWIEARFPPDSLRHLRAWPGKVPAPTHLDETQRQELASLQIPLPSPRVVLVARPGSVDLSPHYQELPIAADPVTAALRAVFAEEGITPDQLQLRAFKKLFFSRGERAAWCFPADLRYNNGIDTLQPSRHALELNFELPRGCYATLLIKRITAE